MRSEGAAYAVFAPKSLAGGGCPNMSSDSSGDQSSNWIKLNKATVKEIFDQNIADLFQQCPRKEQGPNAGSAYSGVKFHPTADDNWENTYKDVVAHTSQTRNGTTKHTDVPSRSATNSPVQPDGWFTVSKDTVLSLIEKSIHSPKEGRWKKTKPRFEPPSTVTKTDSNENYSGDDIRIISYADSTESSGLRPNMNSNGQLKHAKASSKKEKCQRRKDSHKSRKRDVDGAIRKNISPIGKSFEKLCPPLTGKRSEYADQKEKSAHNKESHFRQNFAPMYDVRPYHQQEEFESDSPALDLTVHNRSRSNNFISTTITNTNNSQVANNSTEKQPHSTTAQEKPNHDALGSTTKQDATCLNNRRRTASPVQGWIAVDQKEVHHIVESVMGTLYLSQSDSAPTSLLPTPIHTEETNSDCVVDTSHNTVTQKSALDDTSIAMHKRGFKWKSSLLRRARMQQADNVQKTCSNK